MAGYDSDAKLGGDGSECLESERDAAEAVGGGCDCGGGGSRTRDGQRERTAIFRSDLQTPLGEPTVPQPRRHTAPRSSDRRDCGEGSGPVGTGREEKGEGKERRNRGEYKKTKRAAAAPQRRSMTAAAGKSEKMKEKRKMRKREEKEER